MILLLSFQPTYFYFAGRSLRALLGLFSEEAAILVVDYKVV